MVVCVSAVDQPLDASGLSALADAADIRIRSRLVNPVSPSEIIELTETGTYCPFAVVDRLDTRLADADLEFLEDDLGAFVAEQPSVTVRQDTYEMASGLDELFEPVAAALDIETLRDARRAHHPGRRRSPLGGPGLAGRRGTGVVLTPDPPTVTVR